MSPHELRAKLKAYYPRPGKQTLWDRLHSGWHAVTFRLKNAKKALEEIAGLKASKMISEQLYTHSRDTLQQAVTGVFKARYGDAYYGTSLNLEKNISLFAAHKSAYFTQWIRSRKKDEQQAIADIFQRQLEVEANMASRASRATRQWRDIEKNSTLYPQLEYLPSRSVAKRENHTRYYGMILPVNHSFWTTALPPNGWNCKCRVRSTDATPTKALDPPKPTKGIAGNAGKEKRVFTPQHPFFRNVSDEGKERILKEWRKMERKRVSRWAKKNVQGKAFPSSQGDIFVNGQGVKEMINQNHDQYWEKNQLLFDIETVLKKAKYIKTVPFDPDKKGADVFESIYYFRIAIKDKESYLVMRKQNKANGGKLLLYDVVEILK